MKLAVIFVTFIGRKEKLLYIIINRTKKLLNHEALSKSMLKFKNPNLPYTKLLPFDFLAIFLNTSELFKTKSFVKIEA